MLSNCTRTKLQLRAFGDFVRRAAFRALPAAAASTAAAASATSTASTAGTTNVLLVQRTGALDKQHICGTGGGRGRRGGRRRGGRRGGGGKGAKGGASDEVAKGAQLQLGAGAVGEHTQSGP